MNTKLVGMLSSGSIALLSSAVALPVMAMESAVSPETATPAQSHTAETGTAIDSASTQAIEEAAPGFYGEPQPPTLISQMPDRLKQITQEVGQAPVRDTPAVAEMQFTLQESQPSPTSDRAITSLDASRAESSQAVTAPAELAQLTSVSQLSDVQPTDWSFQALRSLIERYGMIAGYPDGRFRGDRSLSRYEFAAALNAALDAINQQIRTATAAQPNPADLAVLQRLSREFAPELATLRGRIDALEARTAELEAHQFSTTAVLNGQVIFGLAAAGGGDPPGRGTGNVVLNHLTVLQLGASFTGRDALRVALTAGNFGNRGFANPDSLNTNMALLGYQLDSQNNVEIDSLEYRFAAGDRLVFTVKPVGFSLNSVLSANSIFSSTSDGALSRFAAYNPVFRIGNLDAGVGFDYLLTNRLRLQVAYGARNSGDPESGFFASEHRALGIQLFARPTASVTTGIAYVNAFSSDGRLDTFTGSNNADISGGINEPAAVHALSGTLQWQITPDVIFSTWGGVIVTDSLRSNAVTLATTYQFGLSFPDLFSTLR